MPTILSQIRAAQPTWFSAENKRFFNDVKYYACRGKQTNKIYLVRSTYMWSDMLGNPKQLSFRVNTINQETLKIEGLTDDVFKSLEDAKTWVFEN